MKNNGFYGYTNGITNEKEIENALDGKTFGSLSEHLQNVVHKMFHHIEDGDIIHAERIPGFPKPDLKITVNDESHYLSIKYGASAQVHCEKVEVFVKWLKEHQISERVIQLLLIYQYGDGTTDGNGERRMSQQEVLRVYSKEIAELNEELNKDRFFVRDFVKRVVFEGNDPDKVSADFIYHGDIEEGEICSKESVLSYTKRKRFDRLVNVHIGPVMVRPYARYSKNEERYPEKRHQVTFEWNRMLWDLEYINQWKY